MGLPVGCPASRFKESQPRSLSFFFNKCADSSSSSTWHVAILSLFTHTFSPLEVYTGRRPAYCARGSRDRLRFGLVLYLLLPTYSHLLIVNKVLSIQSPLSPTHTHTHTYKHTHTHTHTNTQSQANPASILRCTGCDARTGALRAGCSCRRGRCHAFDHVFLKTKGFMEP